MRITAVEIQNLRNLTDIRFVPQPGINILLGSNAQGKTNFLEAVYLHSNARSFRPGDDRAIAKTGSKGYYSKITYEHAENILYSELIYDLPSNKKEIFINNKKTNFKNTKRVKAVLFTPDDLFLVKGYPAQRRNFIDYLLRQVSEEYGFISDNYFKTLRHRNFLLRQEHADPEVFQALSSVFTELAAQLIRQRLCLVNQLNLTIEDFSASEKISASQFKIKYALSFEPENNDLNKENLQIAIQRKLTATAAQEKKYQRTLCGPHLDDINFYINDKLAKIYASQGQQRSMAIVLKLAELEVFKKIKSYYPVFILDEVLSELDTEKKRALINWLKAAPFQSFITAVSLNNVEISGLAISYVKDGHILTEKV